MNKRIIKTLSTIGILLFFLPFFQTCSDQQLATKPNWSLKTPEVVVAPTAEESAMKAKLLQASKENATVTGYELALHEVDGLAATWVFSLMMLLNFVIWVNALRNQFSNLMIVIFFNIVLILFAFALFLYAASDIRQIKYGMLLFTINTVALFSLIYKENST